MPPTSIRCARLVRSRAPASVYGRVTPDPYAAARWSGDRPDGSARVTKAQLAAAIQAIVRFQLDDSRRAIKEGKRTIALNELDDAIRQLKALAGRLEA